MRKLVPYTMPDGSRPASRLPVILSAVLAVVVVVLLALNVYQYNTVSGLESQLYTQGQELSNVKADLTDAEYDIESMQAVMLDEADSISYLATCASLSHFLVRFVPDDGSGLYHRINCPVLDLSRGWVLNEEAAEDQGFRPCPICNSADTAVYQDFTQKTNSVFDFVDLIQNGDDRDWYIRGSIDRARNSQLATPIAAGPNDSDTFKAVDTVLNSYVSSINSTLDQVIFLASYARVISNDGTRFYHRYGCPHCSTNEFVIYSIGNAQKDGYSPCPTCNSPDSAVAKKIQADIDSMCNLLDLIQNGTESSWVRRAASLQPATPDSL